MKENNTRREFKRRVFESYGKLRQEIEKE